MDGQSIIYIGCNIQKGRVENIMNKTGYNPNAMLAMLENLQKNTSSNYSLGFGKTHPSPQQRINEANKVLRKIKQMDNYNEESRISRFEQAKQYF